MPTIDQMAWKNIGIIRSMKDREQVVDILEARRDFLRLRQRQEVAIRGVYERAAKEVASRLGTASGDLQTAHLQAVQKELTKQAGKIYGDLETLMKQGVTNALQFGGQPLDNHLIRCLQEAKVPIDLIKLQRGFADINTAAVEAFWARTNQKGLRISDRIWEISDYSRTALNNLIQTGIAMGQDAVTIARYLEMYVDYGQKTLAKDYPNMMARMGTRVPNDICYEALRLARTEYTRAFIEGTYSRGTTNPSYLGIKWMLSDGHPEPDVCDDFAENDFYGMGPGVYKKGEEPPVPHPNCLCYVISVQIDTEEFVEDLINWTNGEEVPYLDNWYNEVYMPLGGYSVPTIPATVSASPLKREKVMGDYENVASDLLMKRESRTMIVNSTVNEFWEFMTPEEQKQFLLALGIDVKVKESDDDFMLSFFMGEPEAKTSAEDANSQKAKAIIRNYIDCWAMTSGDHDYKAVAMQLAAQEEFGLKGAVVWWHEDVLESAKGYLDEGNREPMRMFLRKQYEFTQQEFKNKGVDSIILYRGIGFGTFDSHLMPLNWDQGVEEVMAHLQPISSYSSDPQVALNFARGSSYQAVVAADVPVGNVIGWCRTGFGTRHESEFVVMPNEDGKLPHWVRSWRGDHFAPEREDLMAQFIEESNR